MRWRSGVCALALLLLRPGVACSQQVVVQQPEFRQFTAPTTVLVPDGGGVVAGGVGSAAGGRQTAGPVPMSSARAGATGGASVQVRAWVHDFEAMDAALLADKPADPVGPVRR